MIYSKIAGSNFPRVKIISFIILVSCSLNLFAQNDTLPKFYKDSTGKVFISTGTHVYLYIGTSPDKRKSIRLLGDNGNEPIHWSGHGLKKLTHLNLYLGRKVCLNLYADNLPPKTSILYKSGKDVERDSVTYLSGHCFIELNATDPDAGLKNIYYSINEGANIKYIEPISLKSEGRYTLKVFALDNVSNKEEEVTRIIVVDNTPPLSRLDITGDKYENILSGRSSLVITSVDALGVKQTYYCIDSSKMMLYTKPISTSELNEGEHTLNWYSVDEVDNSETIKSSTFFLDKTPPMVFEEIAGNTYMVGDKEYSSGRSQLKIVAVDNKAGIKEINYSLNNREFKIYEKPVYLSDIQGAVSVISYAIDNVNNRSTSNTKSEVFTIPMVDITGPQIFYSFIGPKIPYKDTTWIGPKTKIQITTKDFGAGVNKTTYKEKGGEEVVYGTPFQLDNKGFHEIICTSFDNVDNINLIMFGFGVDNQAPAIYYHFSFEPNGWISQDGVKIPIFSNGLKLYLGATDNKAGVERLIYVLNNQKEISYSSPIERFKTGSTNTVVIKSTDALGNSSEMTLKFRVE
jgi:hypothetical protein